MKTYIFKVLVEPDALQQYGTATWGYTRDGFRQRSGRKGSHQRFKHPDGCRVTSRFISRRTPLPPRPLRA
jgi:hypothetical protein